MNGVLDLQRRGQQIGRLRMGQLVRAANGRMRPDRLTTWRFTTQSRPSADAIAALYGGEVRDWEGQWEVVTRESSIGVTVPPRDQVVSQAYELWSKGGCQRRCDSQHEQISNGPCLCPHAEDPDDEDEVERCALKRADMAKLNPPQACKLVTRISVMIPDLPGLGVFRLDTGSYYAAVEIGDVATVLQMARDQGIFLPAILRIEQRKRVAGGQTKNFPVPVLEITATLRQITSGALEAGGITAQLPPAPGQPKAIAAAPAATPDVPRPAVTPDPGNGEGIRPAAGPGHPGEPVTDDEQQAAADRIADEARAATTDRQFKAIAAKAEALGDDAWICIDPGADEWQQLIEFVRDQYRDRAARRTA